MELVHSFDITIAAFYALLSIASVCLVSLAMKDPDGDYTPIIQFSHVEDRVKSGHLDLTKVTYHETNISAIVDREDAEQWHLPGYIELGWTRFCHWDQELEYLGHPAEVECSGDDLHSYITTCYDWDNLTWVPSGVSNEKVKKSCHSFDTSLERYWVNISGVYRDTLNAVNEGMNVTLDELTIPQMPKSVRETFGAPMKKALAVPLGLAVCSLVAYIVCAFSYSRRAWFSPLFFYGLYLHVAMICFESTCLGDREPKRVARSIKRAFQNATGVCAYRYSDSRSSYENIPEQSKMDGALTISITLAFLGFMAVFYLAFTSREAEREERSRAQAG